MISSKKVYLAVFVVALLCICIEGGYGGGYYRQGNQGGDANLADSQDAFNTNFGSGDLNNQQRGRTAQGNSQDNRNGRRGGYGRRYYG